MEFARKQAKSLDDFRSSGKSIGRLHGIPVGIKDIIDTVGIPTENGSNLDKGRIPTTDAWIVRKLKSEGALLMGKTVSTELAFLDPGKTRNPRAFDHTPGGSSSGSAAAVAAGMVPLAIGTQTGGSVIRPAAYCGVTGFKPSFGAIPRTGVCYDNRRVWIQWEYLDLDLKIVRCLAMYYLDLTKWIVLPDQIRTQIY